MNKKIRHLINIKVFFLIILISLVLSLIVVFEKFKELENYNNQSKNDIEMLEAKLQNLENGIDLQTGNMSTVKTSLDKTSDLIPILVNNIKEDQKILGILKSNITELEALTKHLNNLTTQNNNSISELYTITVAIPGHWTRACANSTYINVNNGYDNGKCYNESAYYNVWVK